MATSIVTPEMADRLLSDETIAEIIADVAWYRQARLLAAIRRAEVEKRRTAYAAAHNVRESIGMTAAD